MINAENQELEDFIQDWYWDEQHKLGADHGRKIGICHHCLL